MRKNRKKQPIGKLIIIASSIITVNLLGVSYAHWNDNLNMAVSITTGSFQPYFIGDAAENTRVLRGEEKLKTSRAKRKFAEEIIIVDDESIGRITANINKKGNEIKITGWSYPGLNENISLKVGNNGTIPIVYNGMEAEEDDEEIINEIQYKGYNIKEDNRKIMRMDQDMIEPKDEEEIEIHLQTENENEIDYGKQTFTYKLQFEQGLR